MTPDCTEGTDPHIGYVKPISYTQKNIGQFLLYFSSYFVFFAIKICIEREL